MGLITTHVGLQAFSPFSGEALPALPLPLLLWLAEPQATDAVLLPGLCSLCRVAKSHGASQPASPPGPAHRSERTQRSLPRNRRVGAAGSGLPPLLRGNSLLCCCPAPAAGEKPPRWSVQPKDRTRTGHSGGSSASKFAGTEGPSEAPHPQRGQGKSQAGSPKQERPVPTSDPWERPEGTMAHRHQMWASAPKALKWNQVK